MRIANIVFACSTLCSLVGCTVREEAPRRTIVRERTCDRHQHWNGRYCVDNHRDRDTTVIIDTRR